MRSRLIVDCRMYSASGIGVYLQNLVPRLTRTIPEDSITLLGFDSGLETLTKQLPQAHVHKVTSKIYTIREQAELALYAGGKNCVWWSPHYNIPLSHRGPLVATVHDLYHLVSRDVRESRLKLAYAHFMFNAVRRHADKVICVSQFTASEYQRLIGGDPARLEVVLNGVDERWFEPVVGERLQPNPYFLFVGNLKPNKNVRGIVRAYDSIRETVPHDLIVVGRREGFITADRESAELARALGPRVKFTGPVELQDLRRWYGHAEALVFPSFYEGFGFPPLEAMAVRCPVVTSNAASLPEVCGDAAIYCDPHDTRSIAAAMLEIVRKPALRAQLVSKGLRQARKFRWDEAASRTSAILRSLMATSVDKQM